MKIAQITYLYHPALGGVENHVRNLSEYLVQRGHQVDVLTSDFLSLRLDKRIKNAEEIVNGVRIKRFSAQPAKGKNFFAQKLTFGPLTPTLLKENYDIFHCHSVPSKHFDQAFSVANEKKKKIFVTPHFSPDDLQKTFKTKLTPWYWRFCLSPKLKRVNQLFAVSPSEKEAFTKLVSIPSEKITVVPNGVNLKEIDRIGLSEVNRLRDRLNPDKKTILFVGRITPVKGVDILIDAVSKIGDIDLQLLIIGPVEDRRYFQLLQQQIKDKGLEEVVKFRPASRPEALAAFYICDVFVLPTRGEVFGIVLAEAMAYKKPVIGTNIGGLPDLIKDGQNGLLFELENSSDLASKIVYLLTHTEEASKIGRRAREVVESEYSWETNVVRVEEIYMGGG